MNDTLFALRRGALLTLVLAFGFVLAACSPSDSEATEPAATTGDGGSGSGTATVENGAVEISAADLEFNVTTIEATAGEDFTITLVNDDSAPHNISVYSEEGGEAFVLGDTAEAGQTVTTDVSALEPGTYYFQCDIHPDMNGQVVVSG
jgi:plastocyanin